MTALAWLEGLPKFSVVRYNLYRTWALLTTLVPNYTQFEIYYITGSKGKGTVAATLAAILRAAGISTGLMTSPHLMSLGERVNLDGADITLEDLEAYLHRIRENLPPLPSRYGTWIFSEVLMAAALLWFREQGTNTLVLEAGLGGRLDPGNVFRRPRATCITTVAMEHKIILGDTVAEIASEKAGIIKPCTPIITAAHGDALAVISRRAQTFAAPLLQYQVDFSWQGDLPQVELCLPDRRVQFRANYETPATQANKAMAACMASLDANVNGEAIIQGIMAPGLPGRFEIIPGRPTLVLDVGHTPEAVANLVEAMAVRFPGKKTTYVAGFLADKDALAMLRIMAAGSQVYVAPLQDKRSFSVEDIALTNVTLAPSIAAAMEKVATDTDVLCVTGSFAAVAQAKSMLSKEY